MATEIERAIIELQVLYRGIHQRLTAMERQLGGGASVQQAEPVAPAEKQTPPSSGPPMDPPQQVSAPPERAAPEVRASESPQQVAPPPAQAKPPQPTPTPLTPEHERSEAVHSGEYGTRVQNVLQQIADRNHSIDASIENIIGQSVLSYVGGLVLFGGILLFLRFTFQEAWLQPGNRVFISLMVGGILLAAGQWFSHSRMRPLAAAITAMGLATFMAALLAASVAYTPVVLEAGPAFVCMILVSAAGVGLAFQLRMQSLAILALVGAYGAPLVLRVHAGGTWGLLGYLSCVTAGGLVICFYRRRWLWLRGVAVMALVVPMYFDGPTTTVAWAMLGLALGMYGVLTGSVVARGVMVAVLGMLSVHLLAINSVDPDLRAAVVSLPNLLITPWMIMMAGAALFAFFLGWLASGEPVVRVPGYVKPVWATILCAAIGTILWYCVALLFLKDLQLITLASLVWIVALVMLGRIVLKDKDDAPQIETGAAALLALTCAKWVLFDLVVNMEGNPVGEMRLPGTEVVLPPFANLFVLNGVLIIMAFRYIRIAEDLGRPFFGWLITGLAFFAMNVEIIRVVDVAITSSTPGADGWLIKNIFVSIFSALFALGIMVVGFTRRYPTARWVALLLFAGTVVKVLVVDMAKVDNSLRILSFTLIGFLLLVVSFMYHKNQPAVEAKVA